MYNDGMQYVSTSCGNGHGESDATFNQAASQPARWPVGLQDLQRRLHRFLIRTHSYRNGMTVRISKVVEGQRGQ